MKRGALTAGVLHAVLEELSLPVLVLQEQRLLYSNPAGDKLAVRLKEEHATELHVLLRDHLETIKTHLDGGQVVSLVTAGNGEPFYVHAVRLKRGLPGGALVTVRELAPDREAFRRRYALSRREGEVVDLVLRGYGNRDIGLALGITPATAKKHLTSVFNKVGTDSRAQLISRLA